MEYKEMRCAAIHDLSGLGKCSLTVALPVLSVCGVETSVIPTAVLSTHTGGFKDYTYVDLTEDMLPFAKHWKAEGAEFEALYSGFLGSDDQIEIVAQIFDIFESDKTIIVIDPVMGDNGKLYPTYTEKMADGIAQLSHRADVLVPNMTEASRILGIEYTDGPYTKEFVYDILERLCSLGPKRSVITGVWFEDGLLGSACRDDEQNKTDYFMHERIEGYFHGTGDLFSSILTGGLLNGMDIFEASRVATEITWETIVTTRDHAKDKRFGPKFEVHMPRLAEIMEKQRKSLHESKF